MPDPARSRTPDPLTWASLLAHWTEFAQASLALPKHADGDRWRAAVAPIIGLQAVTFALGDLDRLAGSEDDRALAIDRAEILIRRHAGELHALWSGEPLHTELVRLIEDARAALRAVRSSGWEWTVASARLIAEHPADLVESLLANPDPRVLPFDGDLFLPAPGVPMMKGSPAAFLRTAKGGDPGSFVAASVVRFLSQGGARVVGPVRQTDARQVYRQFDFAKGGPIRDLVSPLNAGLPAGQPLLLPVIEAGQPLPVPLPPRRAIAVPDLPVEFES